MNTIFSDFSKDVDLSIFKKDNEDPKTPLRRSYLALVGLLEYVDILNGDLPGHALPDGMTVDDVKRMVSHAISDLDTKRAISTDGSLPEHEYVDLGLPSGTLWATENIKDANGNTLYFAWGETHGYTAEQIGEEEGKRAFDDDDYELGPIDKDDKLNYGMKKYNQNDGLTVLEPKDDAATVNWGEGWKMPTEEQLMELGANTKRESTMIGGVSGYKFTSIVEGYTDKFLFFPTTGFGDMGFLGGGLYLNSWWTADVSRVSVFAAMAYSEMYWNISKRCLEISRDKGFPIRPVRTQGIDRTQDPEVAQVNEVNEGTQGSEDTQGTQGTKGAQGA